MQAYFNDVCGLSYLLVFMIALVHLLSYFLSLLGEISIV